MVYDNLEKEDVFKRDYEIMRMIAYYSFIPHVKDGGKIKVTDFMPFSWDSEDMRKAVPDPSKEEIEEIIKKFEMYN